MRKPRVHITYDVETNGAVAEKDIPFVMGVMGDYSGDNADGKKALKDRKFSTIDRDNINDLISTSGFGSEIGILSIDIDGNDYWVWQAIDCVQPRILILEYNALFGPDAAISVPYDASFVRSRAHYSNLFWGASLEALTRLSKQKGYALVGCNSAGNNAFYIRHDVLGAHRG